MGIGIYTSFLRRGHVKNHRRGVLHTPNIESPMLWSLFYKGVCNTPLRSSPQCYRSRVGMLTIIWVDTYALRAKPNKNSHPYPQILMQLTHRPTGSCKYIQALLLSKH